MKVLFLVARPNVRGPIPKITPLLISGLRELGCEVTTEFWGRRQDQESMADKIIGRTADIAHAWRSLARERPDVMVVNTSHDWYSLSRDIPLLLVTRRLCPRIVLHIHGSLADRLTMRGNRLTKAGSALLLRLSDAALVLSSEEQRQWQQFYPKGDVRVVSNPYLPAAHTVPALGRSTWGLPADRPILLFAGRLLAQKGIFDLLEAMPRVLAQMPCHLFVVGSGRDGALVQDRVAQLGLAQQVTLSGYLEGEELRAAYGLADAFVLPSWKEGFPTVIAEAMDAGLPIVTTRMQGMADHLREGQNALFVPPHDPEALAQALLRLVGSSQMRQRMGRANRNKVKEFAPDVVARRYLEILRQVVDGVPDPACRRRRQDDI